MFYKCQPLCTQILTICYVPMYNTLLFIEIDSENVQPMLQIAPGICVPNDIAGTSNQGKYS